MILSILTEGHAKCRHCVCFNFGQCLKGGQQVKKVQCERVVFVLDRPLDTSKLTIQASCVNIIEKDQLDSVCLNLIQQQCQRVNICHFIIYLVHSRIVNMGGVETLVFLFKYDKRRTDLQEGEGTANNILHQWSDQFIFPPPFICLCTME